MQAILSNKKLIRLYATIAAKVEQSKRNGGNETAVLWLDAEAGLYKREVMIRQAEIGKELGLFNFTVTKFSLIAW